MTPTQRTLGSRVIDRLCPTLYEDGLVLALAKPSGVAAGGAEKRMPTGLAELICQLRGQDEEFEPANRLGYYESGVLILGKTPEFISTFRHAMRSGRVNQRYVAVLARPMSQRRVSLDPASGASRGRRDPRSKKGQQRDRRRAGPARAVVQKIRNGPERSMVECRTSVPTTHALRAQLRAAGLRLLGDSVKAGYRRTQGPRETCLHLASIELKLPGDRTLAIRSPVPREDYDAALTGAPNLIAPIRAALVRRLPLLDRPDTDCFRMLGPTGEDLDGLAAEKYGPVVVLQVHKESKEIREKLRPIAKWYRSLLGVEAVFVKDFTTSHGQAGVEQRGDSDPARPFLGRVQSDPVVAIENGLKFLIGPQEHVSVGLFLDHRDNRRRVRELSRDKDVLNLFAYTCSHSVTAAIGGARSTVSVDLSTNYLDWGRGNFELNGLDFADHEFIQSDALEFLKFARRKQRSFDVIILDPPSFAHGRKRGRDFSIERDLPTLVRAATEVLRENGMMMVSTNLRRMSEKTLIERVRAGAAGRRHRVTAKPPLPLDFAADPTHAKTVFLIFD